MNHEEIEMDYDDLEINHEELLMDHEDIEMNHEDLLMDHEAIEMDHDEQQAFLTELREVMERYNVAAIVSSGYDGEIAAMAIDGSTLLECGKQILQVP